MAARGYDKTALAEWLIVAGTIAALLLLMLGKGGLLAVSRMAAVYVAAATVMLCAVLNFPDSAWVNKRIRAWLWVWLAVSGCILIQLSPLPAGLAAALSLLPVGADFAAEGDVSAARLAPNVSAALQYWAMFTLYWALAFGVASLSVDRLSWLIRALTLAAVAQALYGIIAYTGRHETVLGLWVIQHSLGGTSHDVVRGTFTNRNHFAGFLAVATPLILAYLLYLPGTMKTVNKKELSLFFVILIAMIFALALVNTRSRLGTAAAFFGLAMFVVLLKSTAPKQGASLQQRIGLWVGGLFAFGMTVSFGLLPLLLRYSAVLHGEENGRIEAWKALFQLPAHVWVWGVGAGGFVDVFKLIQPASLEKSYLRAHNDWLQFLLEFGVLGAALIAGVVWLWFTRVRLPITCALQAAAYASMAAMALLSIGDFNLQIPGVAVVFWIAVGVAFNRNLATVHLFRRAQRRRRQRS